MFRQRQNDLKERPTLLNTVLKHFGLLALVGLLTVGGFILLVQYQLEPAFRADIYEHLHASFLKKESALITAFLQDDEEKASLAISDTSFLSDADSKTFVLRNGQTSPDLPCEAEGEKLTWATVCHRSGVLYGQIPIYSADQLLGWVTFQQSASLSDWLPYSRILQAVWIASLSILILAFLFIVRFLRTTILPVRKAIEKLEKVESVSEFDVILKDLPFKELVGLTSRFSSRFRELAQMKAALYEAERKAQLSHVASQVAHDLQSPVAALKQVSENMERIQKEDVVRAIRTSARRIDQISRDLLNQFQTTGDESTSSVTFVVPVIETIVGEIHLAHSDKNPMEIQCHIPSELRSSITTLSESNLSRCLSNLIKNAVDAVIRKGSGNVQIYLVEESNEILITIEDTGLGMKAEDLEKVRTSGGTLHEGGHGLGLSFAKTVLASIGGHLKIESSWMKGTKTIIYLPKISKPEWLLNGREIHADAKIAVIDDDPSILDFWKRKLQAWNVSYYSSIPGKFECDLLIIDQEIRGAQETGLLVIERLSLGPKAILSTSFFFSSTVQNKVRELGCFLLPKFLIDHFQISPMDLERTPGEIDLVLIDDDPMCRNTWELMASVHKKNLRTYSSYEDFCKADVAEKTAIYVDKNLSNDVSGYFILKTLHETGYKNIHLTTGEFRTEPRPPAYVLSVVSKEFPLQT